MKLQKQSISPLFLLFAALFIGCILSANIIAVKIINLFGFYLTAGIIVFPISYILGDILTEVYGYINAKRIIWLGFSANLLMVIAILVAQYFPYAPFWQGQKAFETILGFAPRLLLASFTAFLFGSFVNSYVMSKMKLLTKGRFLWSRTIGSTIAGEGVDSILFVTVAFFGIMSIPVIVGLILTQWIIKIIYETVMTPVTYAIVAYLKKKEGTDHFDYKTDYNPFHI